MCKTLLKAGKEKGFEPIKEWLKGIRNHLYWSAMSTEMGFGDMILAKWKSIMRHIADKHNSHPNQLFSECAHGELEPRRWIKIGKPHDFSYLSLNFCLGVRSMLYFQMQVSSLGANKVLMNIFKILTEWNFRMFYSDKMSSSTKGIGHTCLVNVKIICQVPLPVMFDQNIEQQQEKRSMNAYSKNPHERTKILRTPA